ncbi:alpha-1,2-fucosyltransferase [uncultured Mucilaginibacter sp.]|uniref:alpha-1,2-fucosyltransferase n=1 Tax=uncultured Mucilaginibacter sp. TaxID=797541 RepID=UPI0025D65A22|nr:alpha-1,2-fucosyltransferase [uncultured Mucilaginibacter sp.]
MDVVVFFNGLGNQMSQYAFYSQKKSNNSLTYYILAGKSHNGIELNKVFNINLYEAFFQKMLYILFRVLCIEKMKPISTPIKWMLGLLGCEIIKEDFNYNFNKDYLLPSKGIKFYYGGWHAPQYFSSIVDTLRHDFEFEKPNDFDNKVYIDQVSKCNSVAIHVRRGDYLDLNNLKLFGEVCSKAYFETAINIIENKIVQPHFFVFSNDIPWVKSNLIIKNVTYVTCNIGLNSWKDIYLMSICKHNIISNSTFSWWAAWLNKNPQKLVISPSRFLNSDTMSDIYPKEWIRLSEY